MHTRMHKYIHRDIHTFRHTCIHTYMRNYIIQAGPHYSTDNGKMVLIGRLIEKRNYLMSQCDCNIIAVSRIQFLVNKNFFHLLFFDLIVKKYETNNIPKCTPFWHEMFKIASVSRAPPHTPWRAYDAPPEPLVGRGFLPSAIAAWGFQRLRFACLACLFAKHSKISACPESTPLAPRFFRLQYDPLLEIP